MDDELIRNNLNNLGKGTNKSVEELVDVLLKEMKTGRDFTIDELLDHNQFIKGSLSTQLFPQHKEDVLNYLVDNEYAKRTRHEQYMFIGLTNRGKKLKGLGSIDKYISWEQKENEKEDERQVLSDKLLKANLVSAQIQKSLLSINRWIAVATSVAALYYILEIIKHHASNFDLNILTSLVVFLFGIGAGIIISLIITELLNRKNRE